MPQISAELLAKLPASAQPGPLDTVEDLQREWQRVHRAYWRKQITPDEYSGSMYGLQTGTMITRTRDELCNAREQLAQHDRIADALDELQQRNGHVNGHAVLDYERPTGDEVPQ